MTQRSPVSNIPPYDDVLNIIKSFASVDKTRIYHLTLWTNDQKYGDVDLRKVMSYGNIWNAILRFDNHFAKNSKWKGFILDQYELSVEELGEEIGYEEDIEYEDVWAHKRELEKILADALEGELDEYEKQELEEEREHKRELERILSAAMKKEMSDPGMRRLLLLMLEGFIDSESLWITEADII